MSAGELHVHHIRSVGASSGPPVVFLHGFASRGGVDWPDATWGEPLAALGREVLIIDLPGHGASPRPADPPSAADIMQAVAAAVRAHTDGGPDHIDLVGYSLGARLAWGIGGTALLPVRRLALGGLSPQEPFAMVDIPSARAALETGPLPGDGLTAMILTMAAMPGNDPHALLDVVEGFAAEPFDPAVAPPTVPTLVIAGEDDLLTTGIDQVAGSLPDARFVRVPGDHLAALHSDELHAAVIDFLT